MVTGYGFKQLLIGDSFTMPYESFERFERVRKAAKQYAWRNQCKFTVGKVIDREGKPAIQVHRVERDGVRVCYSDPLSLEDASTCPNLYPIAEIHLAGEGWVELPGEPGSNEIHNKRRKLERAIRRYEGRNPGVVFASFPEIRDGCFGLQIIVRPEAPPI